MIEDAFLADTGVEVPAVTAEEMREVDRVAVEEFGIDLLQMMENAGRTLAWHVRDVGGDPVRVVAGTGGNGGGGLACARHLANRGVEVEVVLDREPADLEGAAARQFGIVRETGVPYRVGPDGSMERFGGTVVDALVGYGLSGDLRGSARTLVEAIDHSPATVVSLDVPTGRDATTGDVLGVAVAPDRTVTLALPKTGLDGGTGDLYLADIAIPPNLYRRLEFPYDPPFEEGYSTGLTPA